MSGSATSSSALLSSAVLALTLCAPPSFVQLDLREQLTVSAPSGKVYLTLEEALKLALPDCEIERATTYLTAEQKKLADELAGEALESSVVRPYIGRKDGKIVGTVYFDTHKVRTLRETILVLVDKDQKVARIELLAFGEPDEYAPKAEWYGQFVGKALDDELNLKRGIRSIAGASLTARATTSAVRRVLAAHRVLNPIDGGGK
jgi:hypothetical protein